MTAVDSKYNLVVIMRFCGARLLRASSIRTASMNSLAGVQVANVAAGEKGAVWLDVQVPVTRHSSVLHCL